MNDAEVTLFAALIAAVASLTSLFGNIFFTWRGELRTTHRIALSPFLAELGSAINILLDTCSKYTKQTEGGENTSPSLNEALQVSGDLNEVRTKVKYPLWGIEAGLEVLINLPNWLNDWASDKEAQKRLLEEANNLRFLIDDVIRRSYNAGYPPTKWQIWKVRMTATRLTKNWGQFNR